MTRIWTQRVATDDEYTEARVRDMTAIRGLRLTVPQALAKNWPPKVVFDVRSDHPPGDSFMSGPMLVVSEKLAAIIREVVPPGDFELLPVTVAFERTTFMRYWVLHILRRVDALDRSQSQFVLLEGTIDSIDKLAIDEGALAGVHLCELASIERVVCVSDLLAARIDSSGITGVALEIPEQWTPF